MIKGDLMKLGCHVSIREGYLGAAKLATKLGASVFQYFPKNPRSLAIKEVNNTDALYCREFCNEHKLISIAHSPYPTNLTPSSGDQKQRVIHSLVNDLSIAHACGSIGVVVHFGKEFHATDPLVGYQKMIEIINEVIKRSDNSCKLLLENNAGKPGSIGTTLEELAQIRKLTDSPERIGYCLDTCHAFASGLWTGDNWADLVINGDKVDFFTNLSVIHLNNSRYPVGSGKDRHANILDDGHINEKQWTSLITSPVIQDVPLVLETPSEHRINHKEEIRQLKEKWDN